MEQGKSVCVYISIPNLQRLDLLRGNVKRSHALNKTFDYILSQSDDWIKDLIGSKNEMQAQTNQV